MTRRTTYDAIRAAAAITGKPVTAIVNHDHKAEHVVIRAAVAVVAVSYGRTLQQIGRALGGRDHTTILNYIHWHAQRPRVVDLAAQLSERLAVEVPWHCRPVLLTEGCDD